MILTIFLWLIEGIVLFAYGRLFLRAAARVRGGSLRVTPSLTLTFLAGILLVTTIACLLSFVTSLSALAVGLVLAGAILILILELRRTNLAQISAWLKAQRPSRIWLLLVLLILGLVIDLSTRRPANPDTGIYHAQAIQWMETYPVVPGLGNLHSRFAYNSSWLVVNALFSFAFLGIRSFHVLPGLTFFLFCLSGMAVLRKIGAGKARLSDWFLVILLPLSFFTIAPESSSPGTDLPAILLTWILLSEWMAQQEAPEEQPLRPLVLSLAGVFALTIKLSTAPLLILPAIYFMQALRQKSGRTLALMGLGSLLIVAPWAGRNVVLSGYLVYPEPEINIFNVDWKIPPEQAAYERTVIQAWARIPREDALTVMKMPFATWVNAWYQNLPLRQRAMLWGCLLGPASAGLAFLFLPGLRRRVGRVFRRLFLGWMLAWAGLIYWFFSAPDFRFGIGFVLAALVLGWLPWVAFGWTAMGAWVVAAGAQPVRTTAIKVKTIKTNLAFIWAILL